MTTSVYDSPTDVPGTEDLKERALDMRWSWDHGADELWNQIEPPAPRVLVLLEEDL